MLHEHLNPAVQTEGKQAEVLHFIKALFPPFHHATIIFNLLICSLWRPPAAAGENATPSAFSLRWATARCSLSSGLFSWTGQCRCQWPWCTFGRSWPESLLLGETSPPKGPCLYQQGAARRWRRYWRWCCGRFPDVGKLHSCFSSWWRQTGLVCSGGWHTGLRLLSG